jgi:hypothetical protein
MSGDDRTKPVVGLSMNLEIMYAHSLTDRLDDALDELSGEAGSANCPSTIWSTPPNLTEEMFFPID